MSKSTVATIGLVALGTFALLAYPIAMVLAMYAGLGFATLTTLYLVQIVVNGARALIPLRAGYRFKPTDAERHGITRTVVLVEVGVAAVAFGLLAATSWWWQPRMGTTLPLWMLGVYALRGAAQNAMVAQAMLRRPAILFIALAEMLVVLPVVALITRSLAATIVVSTVITWLLLAVTTRVPVNLLMKPTSTRDPNDRWMLGTWLRGSATSLRQPVLVVVAGAALLIPYTASTILASLLALPFLAIAIFPGLPKSPVLRATVGTVMAGLAFLVVRELGPSIYRTILPDSFGDGSLLPILAWACVALVPASLRPNAERASQPRLIIAGLIDLALLVGLTLAYGMTGVLLACSATTVVTAVLGLTNKTTEPLITN